MKIAMIGTGYVGLVTGACLAKIGHRVTCVDQDSSKVRALRRGNIPIYEPGLETVVEQAVAKKKLTFTTDLAKAVKANDIVFIAVGTPQASDGRSDLRDVEAAAKQIAKAANKSKIVVVKSTVPAGTCKRVGRILGKHGGEHTFDVVSNPEFLREGDAVNDFLDPDRIVIGTATERAANAMRKLYAPFEPQDVPLVLTSLETSELIKYSANAFLATKVAFINEMANLCDATGADIEALSRGIGLDNRIGRAFLKPGPGYGGSCFPKDTLALTVQAQEADCPVRIVESVVDSNSFHIRRLGRRITDFCAASWGETSNVPLVGKRIAILGLAFKANTDDVRSAASTVIAPLLSKQGAEIVGYDPAADKAITELIPTLERAKSIEEAIKGADAAIVLTEWAEIGAIDWPTMHDLMRQPVVVDLRNLYNTVKMAQNGFYYLSLGRPHIAPV
ncbi:UDP-glucose dehydrogenase family protein [Pseudahrensia aquimaris]|uniref:UDP-glucose 6-dehydrogenase n=1 Tax=Pseudahrensia aquimaris TaxID=744461 RepID=A0ABW3FCI4_9HYPH